MKRFLGVYCTLGRDAKVLYANMTIEKDIIKLAEAYKKHTGSDVKV